MTSWRFLLCLLAVAVSAPFLPIDAEGIGDKNSLQMAYAHVVQYMEGLPFAPVVALSAVLAIGMATLCESPRQAWLTLACFSVLWILLRQAACLVIVGLPHSDVEYILFEAFVYGFGFSAFGLGLLVGSGIRLRLINPHVGRIPDP